MTKFLLFFCPTRVSIHLSERGNSAIYYKMLRGRIYITAHQSLPWIAEINQISDITSTSKGDL